MGAALDLLNEHKLLKVDRLGEMLGKPLQFKMQVWNKPTKNGGTWYTEDTENLKGNLANSPTSDLEQKRPVNENIGVCVFWEFPFKSPQAIPIIFQLAVEFPLLLDQAAKILPTATQATRSTST